MLIRRSSSHLVLSKAKIRKPIAYGILRFFLMILRVISLNRQALRCKQNSTSFSHVRPPYETATARAAHNIAIFIINIMGLLWHIII